MFDFNQKIDAAELDLKDTVVSINRVTKVVKGGKNLSFSALVIVGDSHGHVGFGIGKAKEVPSAIKKGIEAAKKSLIRVPLQGTTVPHPVVGRYGAGRVLLKPAPDGTGIIAGAAVRAVVESAGVTNVKPVATDALLGWPDDAPYDVIFLNGAAETVPQAWLNQLKPGGRLGVIVRNGAAGSARIYTLTGDTFAYRVAFDAAPPVLPALARAPAFQF